jgi:hypothetical protein
MKLMSGFVLAGLSAALLGLTQEVPREQQESEPSARFAWVDVFIDTGDEPLAAYQFELLTEAGEIRIVGVEGGEHPAFGEPPYYDPAALHGEGRIIIGAFDTGDELPIGNTRVARVHVQIIGEQEPEFEVQLDAAASADGAEITATATAVQGERK